MDVRPVTPADKPAIERLMHSEWGSTVMVSRGVLYHPVELPGFVAEEEGEVVGFVTYHLAAGECQVVTIDALRPFQGIGTQLITAVGQAAQAAGCRRLWLITTNDNLPALRFYQRRGFTLVAIHRNALAHSRQIKPEIPLIGLNGIPLRDEIELEMILPTAE
mgnify:CR=1 FL=1